MAVAPEEHALPDMQGRARIPGAEQHPGHGQAQKGHQHAQGPQGRQGQHALGQAAAQQMPEGVVDQQEQAVQGPPEEEGQPGPVPDTADQHGQQQIGVLPHPAVTAAAQGLVQAVMQPAAQGHVPAAPEVHDTRGLVGRGKILRQAQAQHEGGPHGHVRITGKVEIDLEGVAQGPQPGLGRTQGQALGGGVEHGIRRRSQTVGQQHLLGQAQHHQPQAPRQIFGLRHLQGFQLRAHLLITDQRAGQGIGEAGGEQGLPHDTFGPDAALVDAQQPGQLDEHGKGEDRGHGRGRQNGQDVLPLRQPGRQGRQMAETAPDQHVEQHGQKQQAPTAQPTAAVPLIGQQQAEQIVDHGQAQQEQQGLQPLAGPKKQRGPQQEHGQSGLVFSGSQFPEPDEDGQEEEQEGEGSEKHKKNLPARHISRRPPREKTRRLIRGIVPNAARSQELSSALNLRDRRKTTTLRGGSVMASSVCGLRPLRDALS